MTGLDASDFDQIPASALADSIEDIANKDFDPSQCRAIVNKVNILFRFTFKFTCFQGVSFLCFQLRLDNSYQ